MMISDQFMVLFFQTINHIIVINDISTPYQEHSSIIKQIKDSVTDELNNLEESIQNGIDFQASQKLGRPVIRFGLDEQLDASMYFTKLCW